MFTTLQRADPARPEQPPRNLRKAAPWPREPDSPLSTARNEIWVPRAPLASCLRAILCRDTRGVALGATQRYNHYPATPACSITWYFSGECALLSPASPAQADSPRQPIERIAFNGPLTRPIVTSNPGPIHVMVLIMLPDALSLLTGIDPSAWIDRAATVEEVFDASWLEMCHAVDVAGDDEARVVLIESFLLPRWRQVRPQNTMAGRLFSNWSHDLARRAAESGLGRSLRQVERRIKQWTGQPLRELRGIGRSEQAFFDAVAALKDGEVNWSDVASNNGYADQSHLCRQTRRITGFAPDDLRRRIATEESFWGYRLWGYSGGLPEE